MSKVIRTGLAILCLNLNALPQSTPQNPADGPVVRITSELVQLDVVVTDKDGRLITDLNRNEFVLLEKDKKQSLTFFEFVPAGKESPKRSGDKQVEQAPQQGPVEADVKRIFGFVVDDLTIGYEDLTYIRQMLAHFVDKTMREGDLVSIVRTVGGKGLLQQFTTNKDLLHHAINSLTPRPHPLSQSDRPPEPSPVRLAADAAAEPVDLDTSLEDLKESLRSYMSLSTASFVIESMKQLPGRKSLVLISGGLPILSTRPRAVIGDALYFLNQLSDNATRAGVAIHTLDVRGLSSGRTAAVQSVAIGPTVLIGSQGGPGLPTGGDTMRGRPDVGVYSRSSDMFFPGGRSNVLGLFDIANAQQGLRVLSHATGGIPVLNRNDFKEGLGRIASSSDGYYLLAYTPSDSKFDNRFRRVEIGVNRPGAKVYHRRGYFAREDKAAAVPATKREQILAAVKSPLARRDIDLDALLLYKGSDKEPGHGTRAKTSQSVANAKNIPLNYGAIDIHMVIDPKKLQFEQAEGKHETSFDVAGFVFDEFGKLRGGFNETVNAKLTAEELQRVTGHGLTYSANTILPSGTYLIRLAVRDNKSNQLGTVSRYLEVPDLSKGYLAASSLLLGAVPAGDMKAENPTPVSANRRVSKGQDLRYAVVIYNAKLKEGRPHVKTQLKVNQGGKVLFEEAEEVAQSVGSNASQLIKWGQLGLKGVKAGRYTLTLLITDTLADKKAQTITRSMDFVVVN